tara:strand:- start:38 stop:1462 length:1425 start_codon:yes stop_codon:yes gene_type:complete
MVDQVFRGGEYVIEQADLVLSTGKHVGLKAGSILNLTIFEDIHQFALTGQIMIQDALNLGSYGPIIGQEYLLLKIRTPTIYDEDGVIDYSENGLMITSVDTREDVGNGVQATLLSFVSREFVVNQRTRVNRTLTGSYSDIVTQMLRKDLNSKKKLHIESSSENKKIIAPNIEPYDVIKLALKEGVSKDDSDPTYLFFENTRGFNYRTLGNLYKGLPVINYTKSVAGTKFLNNGAYDIMANVSNIESYTIASSPDIIYNTTTGVYGSKLIVHDIVSKSYDTYTYNYIDNFSKERHIDNTLLPLSGPLLNALPIIPTGENIASFPSRQFLKPTTGRDKDLSVQDEFYQSSFTSNTPHRSLQRRASSIHMLETSLQVTLEVLGNTLIGVGDIVECNIPHTSTFKSADNNTDFDALYSGRFLIKKLRHDFNQSNNQHKITMNLCKDNLIDSLHSPPDNFEPISSKPEKTINTDDNIGL